jgi:hypothetical protein
MLSRSGSALCSSYLCICACQVHLPFCHESKKRRRTKFLIPTQPPFLFKVEAVCFTFNFIFQSHGWFEFGFPDQRISVPRRRPRRTEIGRRSAWGTLASYMDWHNSALFTFGQDGTSMLNLYAVIYFNGAYKNSFVVYLLNSHAKHAQHKLTWFFYLTVHYF